MLVASRGVTFVLAVTSLLYYSPFLYFTFKYATAAYASFEASLKTCNETSCYSKFICKHLGTFISEICSNSLHQAMNLYFRSSRESFHSSPCNHNSCIIIFPHMIFGAKNPNGLNRVAILVRTILLVMLSFSSLFDTVNVNWSFCGNHCTPRVLTFGRCFSNISISSALSSHGICSKTFVQLEIHFLAYIPAVFHNFNKST